MKDIYEVKEIWINYGAGLVRQCLILCALDTGAKDNSYWKL